MAKVGRPKKDEKDKAKYQLIAVRPEDYIVFKSVFDDHPLATKNKMADVLGSLMRGYAEKMQGHKDGYDTLRRQLDCDREIREALERHNLKPWEITAHTINSYSRVHPDLTLDEIIEENISMIKASQESKEED